MKPFYESDQATIYQGDALSVLSQMPDESFHCCVTSPPYWGLRNYGVDGQIGLEDTLEGYVRLLVEVFGEVRRVLRDDGTLWLNLGDAYSGGGRGGNPEEPPHKKKRTNSGSISVQGRRLSPLKPKDLIGMPWRVAFALQSAGWWLRSDIIWAKPNPMPESVRDRPTRAHEYIFLLSKSARYYYDADAIREKPREAMLKQIQDGYDGQATKDYAAAGAEDPSAVKSRIIQNARKKAWKTPDGWDTSKGEGGHGNFHKEGREKGRKSNKQRGHSRRHDGFNDRWDSMTKAEQMAMGANKRTVWNVATQPFKRAHFATFPEKLIEPCILAGCPPNGTVLDPFLGSGTTALVAINLGRKSAGIELNPDYCKLARSRIPQPSMIFEGMTCKSPKS